MLFPDATIYTRVHVMAAGYHWLAFRRGQGWRHIVKMSAQLLRAVTA